MGQNMMVAAAAVLCIVLAPRFFALIRRCMELRRRGYIGE
jgi:hypothetical protein